MSAPAVEGAGVPAGELALAARVRQIDSMIEEARTGVPRGASAPSGSSFAQALAQAGAGPAASAASFASEAGGGRYEAMVDQAAQRNGLDPAILHGLIQQESGFDPNSQSSAGAMGLTQLMPGTASSLGVSNPLDPAESIEGGARYLAGLMRQFGGNTSEALAAYNAGPGAVSAAGGIPPYPETEDYVAKVLGYAESYRRSHPVAATGSVAL